PPATPPAAQPAPSPQRPEPLPPSQAAAPPPGKTGAAPATPPTPAATPPPAPPAPPLPAAGRPLPSALRVPGPLSRRIANYRIAVELDADKHRLTAREHLEWHNATTSPATQLEFHLYMNAFKNENTTLMREGRLGEGRAVRVPDHWGSIDVRSIRLGAVDLRPQALVQHCIEEQPVTPDCPKDETVMDLPLPEPVAPGDVIDLDIEFDVQLPNVIERTGYADRFHMIGQWFPKIAVYEPAPGGEARWNCHQFHADSEFFADFGEYVVELTVPARYLVAATGVRVEERDTPGGKKTYLYHAEDVHDFSWTADPDFRVAHDTFEDVELSLLYHAGGERGIAREFAIAKASLGYLGRVAFPYPYRTLTIVEPTAKGLNAGGMEYPTLITTLPNFAIPRGAFMVLEDTTAHEFGHQYWYGMLASNEFEEAWLDEGVNTYVTGLVLDEQFGRDRSNLDLYGLWSSGVHADHVRSARNAGFDALETFAWRFAPGRYDVVYYKTSASLRTLEGYLGHERMMAALGAYARAWRFRHPHAQDFFDAFSRASGEDLSWFFEPAFRGTEVLDYEIAELHSQEHKPLLGLFDRDGKRVEVKPESVEKPKEKPQYDTEVLVHRIGDFRFPVEVLVTFEDGSSERVRWDGRDRWKRFLVSRPAAATAATVDPDGKVILDVNWLNNSRRSAPNTGPARRMQWGLAFWVQNLMQAMGL
ncbi:MAG TPA: M1 family metallopeptidase, partial [Polyangia bacterium]|nr:M1 family metallopeptidase [Polyangia bacterium]